MKTWLQLYQTQAIYESDVIDISSDFDYYIDELNLQYEENDGFIDVEIRLSYDEGFTWTDWVDIKSDYYHDLFYIDGIRLNFIKMQYRIIMNINEYGASPVFKSFDIKLYGSFKIFNTGDLPHLPEIWIKKINGSGDVHLINETTGQEVIFENLSDNETVYVDCYNKDILTDLPLTYRYDNHNGQFLKLEVGENVISGYGDFEFVIRNEFRVLQG